MDIRLKKTKFSIEAVTEFLGEDRIVSKRKYDYKDAAVVFKCHCGNDCRKNIRTIMTSEYGTMCHSCTTEIVQFKKEKKLFKKYGVTNVSQLKKSQVKRARTMSESVNETEDDVKKRIKKVENYWNRSKLERWSQNMFQYINIEYEVKKDNEEYKKAMNEKNLKPNKTYENIFSYMFN